MTTDTLERALGKLPRIRLAHLPTPLERLDRFSEYLGGPKIYIKRDDCTGLAFGGNKTRHNEFVFGEVLERGCDSIVWGASVQSNNCRQTAATCARLNIPCQLVLSTADHDAELQGNLLLDHILGAEVELTDRELGEPLWDLLRERSAALSKAGKSVFTLVDPSVRTAATASYVLAYCETRRQWSKAGFEPAGIYVCSAGTTGAGLALARDCLGDPGEVLSIQPIQWEFDVAEYMASFVNLTAGRLGVECHLDPAGIDVRPDFIGKGYGIMTPEGLEAIRALARLEGIFLDPVYTSKAMAALIHDVRDGRWSKQDQLVFVHTGGTPAMFAYHQELVSK